MQGQRSVPAGRQGRAPVDGASRPISRRFVASLLTLPRRHPGKVLGVAGCLAMAGTIVGNAVLFQSGRHPAPLFGHDMRVSQPAAGLPLPVPRPAAPTAPVVRQIALAPLERKPETDGSTLPTPLGTNTNRAPVAKPPPVRRADAIAKLLHGTDQTAVGTADVDPRILAAQRSLARLGFAVKPDGRMGGSTRRALETFGRDHHVAVGSDLSQKVLRELATAVRPPG